VCHCPSLTTWTRLQSREKESGGSCKQLGRDGGGLKKKMSGGGDENSGTIRRGVSGCQEPPPSRNPVDERILKISSEITWNSFFFFRPPLHPLKKGLSGRDPTCQYFAPGRRVFSLCTSHQPSLPPSTNVPVVGAMNPARDCSKIYLARI